MSRPIAGSGFRLDGEPLCAPHAADYYPGARFSRIEKSDWPSKTGMLLWSGSAEGFEASERLSPTRDFREAAANLYSAMSALTR